MGLSAPSTRPCPNRSATAPARASRAEPARNRSSRVPAAASGTRSSMRVTALSRAPALEHPEERQDAERDRHVGDVERRPVRELDEVGHPAVARSGRSGCRSRRRPASRSGSHSSGRSGRIARYPTSNASAASVNTSTSAPPPANSEKATPVFRSCTSVTPGRNLSWSPSAILDRDQALRHLVEDHHDRRDQLRRARRPPPGPMPSSESSHAGRQPATTILRISR